MPFDRSRDPILMEMPVHHKVLNFDERPVIESREAACVR
jgi:hypothetical protein